MFFKMKPEPKFRYEVTRPCVCGSSSIGGHHTLSIALVMCFDCGLVYNKYCCSPIVKTVIDEGE